MTTLQIDNLPDDIYRNLQNLATQKNFTLDEAVVLLLRQALQSVDVNVIQEQSAKSIAEVLAKIRSRPRMNPIDFGLLDSTILIRDDRNR
ncbi:MAG: hypothetical protein HC895_01005 [Leptolyngbyaceae cyanobacterium SM1_3_5]|nr:hypothetical protein [Leptolyngbyaceae cyanobacterium SM1_3_5]